MQRPSKETLEIECVLTKDEKLAYSEKLAHANQNLYSLENKKKAYNTQIKAEMEKSEAEVAYLSQAIGSGKEYREIECRIEYDWDDNKMFWIRIDTGEPVKDARIPDDLRQESAL